MSGTFPTSPKFNSINITSNDPNIVTISTSGRRQVKSQMTQFWTIDANLPTMTRAQWAPIAAFVKKQKGATESFQLTLPEYSTTQGALTTQSVTVNGVHAVGDTTITLAQGSLSLSNALKAGDFVTFSGHTKVYMVVADFSLSSGAGTLTIEPPLISALANSETLAYKDMLFTVFLVNDQQEWNMGLASTVGYEIEFREAI